MTRRIAIFLLALLWALWAYFFVECTRFAYAFTHNIFTAALPGSPIGLDRQETIEWGESVSLVDGTPIILAIVTWRLLRGRDFFFKRKLAE
jgi:hypothetical protein